MKISGNAERLTRSNPSGSASFVMDGETIPTIMTTDTDMQVVLDRLAAYEDTGLTPEEISSLNYLRRIEEEAKLAAMWGYGINPERLHDIVEAEKDGRLRILPCKFGTD